MATVSIKALVLKHRPNPDKTFNIKLRISFKNKSRYIPTSETASPGQMTKSLEFKDPALKARLATLVAEMHSHISKIDTFTLQLMTVDEVVSHIQKMMTSAKDTFRLDFIAFGYEFAAAKPKYSGNNYRTALRNFCGYLKSESIDISCITSSLLRKYENYLVDRYGQNARAVSLYTSSIAAIHAHARKLYNDNELGEVLIRNPYDFYTPPKQKPAPKYSIPARVIQKLIDIRPKLSELDKLAVDVFLLSFCLMGSNVPDIHCAVKESDDVIFYNRTKTKERRYDKAPMYIRIEPIVRHIFDEYADPDGVRAFNLYHRYTFYKSIADKGNDRLKVVAELIGEKPFSMKAARHTWATIANSIGIPKGLVNDCLCHIDDDMVVTDIYITKDWSLLWDANKKVLEQFRW